MDVISCKLKKLKNHGFNFGFKFRLPKIRFPNFWSLLQMQKLKPCFVVFLSLKKIK